MTLALAKARADTPPVRSSRGILSNVATVTAPSIHRGQLAGRNVDRAGVRQEGSEGAEPSISQLLIGREQVGLTRLPVPRLSNWERPRRDLLAIWEVYRFRDSRYD